MKETMKMERTIKAVKAAATVLGALVLGGFMGWCFEIADLQPAVGAAIILTIFAVYEPVTKKNREKKAETM